MRPYPDRRNLSDHGAVAPSANDPAQNSGHNDRVQQRNAGPGFENSAAHERLGTMNRRKFLAGSAATLTGSGLLVGTQSISRVESRRTVRIQVEDDEDAYLGLYPEISFGGTWEIEECNGELQLGLSNQTKEDPIDVTVALELEGDSIELEEDELEATVPRGETRTVTIEASCDPGADEEEAELELDISGEGEETDDTLIQAHRELTVECSCPETETRFVAFCGDIDESDIDLDVTASQNRETVDWELDPDPVNLDQIVLYGGYGSFGCLPSGPVFINVEPSGTSGTVTVRCSSGNYTGDGTAVSASNSNRSQSCPCSEETTGVKFEIADDGTIEGVKDGCSG
jgi:hypothetical protein